MIEVAKDGYKLEFAYLMGPDNGQMRSDGRDGRAQGYGDNASIVISDTGRVAWFMEGRSEPEQLGKFGKVGEGGCR